MCININIYIYIYVPEKSLKHPKKQNSRGPSVERSASACCLKSRVSSATFGAEKGTVRVAQKLWGTFRAGGTLKLPEHSGSGKTLNGSHSTHTVGGLNLHTQWVSLLVQSITPGRYAATRLSS